MEGLRTEIEEYVDTNFSWFNVRRMEATARLLDIPQLRLSYVETNPMAEEHLNFLTNHGPNEGFPNKSAKRAFLAWIFAIIVQQIEITFQRQDI